MQDYFRTMEIAQGKGQGSGLDGRADQVEKGFAFHGRQTRFPKNDPD